MAVGDGIRRNIAHVTAEERRRFRDAFLELNNRYYPDGVSKWVKQDDIHQVTHVHNGPSFLPWHRELCNRLEALLREVDPELSLHYWDWTTDPRQTPDGVGGTVNLFTTGAGGFMGSPSGSAGAPLDVLFPPEITRDVANGNPAPSPPAISDDNTLITSANSLPMAEQYPAFSDSFESVHDGIHGYIGGNIGALHSAFEDPFVYLLHSNVDRLFAMWQTWPGQEWRLDPDLVYGNESDHIRITEDLEPWAGGSGLRPWAPPDNQQEVKNSKHPSVVVPPCYDTLPTTAPQISVANPASMVNFNDVPEGETTARAGVFNVYSCITSELRVKAGTEPSAPFSVLSPGDTVPIDPTKGTTKQIRMWFGFTGTTADTAEMPQTVTVECPASGQEFELTLTANTIERQTAAVVLSLDQSGSMDLQAGDTGAKRIEVLRDAATRFVELVQVNNGIGIIRFDHDAYPVDHPTYGGYPISRVLTDSDLDAVRIAARNVVAAHDTNLAGFTSIGDGVALARDLLNALPPDDYTNKAIVVFTDGIENRPQSIANVMGSIDDHTYAIGLGNESQVSTAALTSLTNGTGGYLLLTGHLSSSIDDFFRLTKYFLQVLAGVTNNEIILDPSGFLAPGKPQRIPVQLTESETEVTTILLTDFDGARLRLETPAGEVIEPATVTGFGGHYGTGTDMQYYRLSLPVPLGDGAHAGIWHALLDIDPDIVKKHLDQKRRDTRILQSRVKAHGIRYSLLVQARSSLKMRAQLFQNSLEPDAKLTLRAVLNQYGIPLSQRGSMKAVLERPDQTSTELELEEVEPGVFERNINAPLSGTYRIRLLARGATLAGNLFTREFLLTGATLRGGDGPFPFGDQDEQATGLLASCCRKLARLAWIGLVLFLLILVVLIFK